MGTADDRLGGLLGSRYLIEREVGAGGTAKVYLARDQKHDRQVAVKVLRKELATADVEERFLREIRLAAQLSHQNILPLFDSGAADGLMFYVMPFIEEPTLRERIGRDGPLSIDDAVALALEIAEGLQYAHEQGIVHRDIKPANILQRRGHALIADFGIARAFEGSVDPTLTKSGIAIGTLAYMSPEQLVGDPGLDHRTDIYSLGCVLFEALTGERLYSSLSSGAASLKRVRAMKSMKGGARADALTRLEAVLRRATAPVAADRFASCAEFSVALRAAMRPPPAIPRRALVLALTVVAAAALFLSPWRPGFSGDDSAQVYSALPEPDVWVGQEGESYSIVATTDSLLVFNQSRARSLSTYDGKSWSTWSVPDSFELRPYRGALRNGRLLAARAEKSPTGGTRAQLWWLELSSAGLRVAEPLAEFEDGGLRPTWWYDGESLVTGLTQLRRFTGQRWTDEPTGASGAIVNMWGRDVAHRYAIASAPSDSLLVSDNEGWRMVDILPDRSGGTPWYAGGGLLGDGGSVVYGRRCVDDLHCDLLVLTNRPDGRAWRQLRLARGVGLPGPQGNDLPDVCNERFDFVGSAGRSVDDFYLWGEWTFCRRELSRYTSTQCPRGQPCVWHVVDGKPRAVPELAGTVLLGMVLRDETAYAVVKDGTLWRLLRNQWRLIGQTPELPSRLVGASSKVVVLYRGNRMTYQTSASDSGRFAVRPFVGLPSPAGEAGTLREIVVRDSTVLAVTASGVVLTSECVTLPPNPGNFRIRCGDLAALAPAPERVEHADMLPDGSVLATGKRKIFVHKRGGGWRIEPLPREAQRDSLWSLSISVDGDVKAIGTNVILTRNAGHGWSVVGHHDIDASENRHVVGLPRGGIAVADRWLRVRHGDEPTSPTIQLQPYDLGSGHVSALHLLADGRLVAGFSQSSEPSVGGWLRVWDPPYRAGQGRRIELPMNVDITDLSDDGTNLYVVGRGGTMAIRLDALAGVPTAQSGIRKVP